MIIRADPGLDRELLLSYVLRPSQLLHDAPPPGPFFLTAAELAMIHELADEGLEPVEIGRRVGRPRSTVAGALLRRDQRARGWRAPADLQGFLTADGFGQPGTPTA